MISEYERKNIMPQKTFGGMTVTSEGISPQEVMKALLLKPYSLFIVDFNTEDTVSLVGKTPRALIESLSMIWPEGYSVEFCIGTIWRNDTGEIVAQLNGDMDDLPGHWDISGSSLIEASSNERIDVAIVEDVSDHGSS